MEYMRNIKAINIIINIVYLSFLLSQVESDDSIDDGPTMPVAIMIPTAPDDPLSPMTSFCNLYMNEHANLMDSHRLANSTGCEPRLPFKVSVQFDNIFCENIKQIVYKNALTP